MGKLDARAVESIFIGYSAHSKGYVFGRERGGGKMMEIESHDVEFLEDVFSSISQSHSTIELQEIPDIDLPLSVARDIGGPGTIVASGSSPMIVDDSESGSSIPVPVKKSV